MINSTTRPSAQACKDDRDQPEAAIDEPRYSYQHWVRRQPRNLQAVRADIMNCVIYGIDDDDLIEDLIGEAYELGLKAGKAGGHE